MSPNPYEHCPRCDFVLDPVYGACPACDFELEPEPELRPAYDFELKPEPCGRHWYCDGLPCCHPTNSC